MTVNDFLAQLNINPNAIAFNDTMAMINDNYSYKPTAFKNGLLNNAAGTNEGSCKIFAFALLNQLTQMQTLPLFGDYYRVDVLNNPQGENHQNIRNFMQFGWAGICFEGEVLTAK